MARYDTGCNSESLLRRGASSSLFTLTSNIPFSVSILYLRTKQTKRKTPKKSSNGGNGKKAVAADVAPVESSSTDTAIVVTNEVDVKNDAIDENKVDAEASIEEKETDIEAVEVSTEEVHNTVDTSGDTVADHLSEAKALSTEPVM